MPADLRQDQLDHQALSGGMPFRHGEHSAAQAWRLGAGLFPSEGAASIGTIG
jgi:hypothetical protein